MNHVEAIKLANLLMTTHERNTDIHKLAKYVLDMKFDTVEIKGLKFPNIRSQVLLTAENVVNGDRNASYGDPLQDFKRTAGLWNILINSKIEEIILANEDDESLWSELLDIINPEDVAKFMILLKVSRSMASKKLDNAIDIAGYAACMAHCEFPDGQ